jgi:multimeric flavodoxin WrbA
MRTTGGATAPLSVLMITPGGFLSEASRCRAKGCFVGGRTSDGMLKAGKAPDPRKGMPSPRLDQDEFKRRFRAQFQDPAFDALAVELDAIAGAAWDAYAHSRKSPRTRKAGPAFADPDYELSIDWIAAHGAVKEAQRQYEDPATPDRFLLINASSRSEHTCPGEMSKSFRLTQIAREVLSAGNATVELLDLSRLASEYGRHIHPCKACFSTAAALCHWPCSCYPNYSLGQTHDWMNEIYPMWVRAHGVMIVTPVNWYQVSSPLKLMMDRLVCADGGNPDPTLTHGKDAKKAKELELAGWDYPRHLAGRLFAVVVHGDVEGAENVRRSISEWLSFMQLSPAGPNAELDRYIGYWKPYATSHDELDADEAIQEEVRNVARTLMEGVSAKRSGRLVAAGQELRPPREK